MRHRNVFIQDAEEQMEWIWRLTAHQAKFASELIYVGIEV